MLDWLKRLVFSLAGGALAALLVAGVEARAVAASDAGASAPGYGALLAADLGVLAPLGICVALAVGLLAVALEPDRPRAPQEHLANVRNEPVLARTRLAALAPLSVLGAFVWCVAVAHLARSQLSHGAPFEAAVRLAFGSLVLTLVLVAVALALLPPLRRLLAAGAGERPRLIDPVTTGAVALVLVAVGLAWGIHVGDAGGEGEGPLAIFGVLKRPELDLRPVIDLGAIAMAAYLAPIALAPRAPLRRALAAVAVVALSLAVTAREAHAMNEAPELALALSRSAPLGKVGLLLVRRATDRDRDGASGLFAGGDCDDRDPTRSPNRVDVPGNGVDEDCTGDDLVLADPAEVKPASSRWPTRRFDPVDNLVLITVDTLRLDEGFMGYPEPVTPNLDRLAQQCVVFDRAYAMASYTGKSIGPLLIGKYPSETQRDGGHFNAYFKSNVFVTERFEQAGVHTMGAASHWYFAPWSGLSQGMDEWDLSARPAGGQGDNDTSVTSEQLSDAAIRLLSNPGNTSKRFFLWLHYFDPHEQYMPHPGAPDFAPERASYTQRQRAAYDAEVWFTDKHVGRVLDYVDAQPWGAKTAIVVTSDHGEAFGEHSMNWHGFELWEPLVQVPLLVCSPGARPHHVPVKRSHIDLVPTLLDLMGLPLPGPKELSGQSLMPDLLAKPGEAYEERDVYIDMPDGPYTHMRHALISGPTPGDKLIHFGGNQYELFDLEADPGEKQDLASDRARLGPMLKRYAELRRTLREIDVPAATPPPAE